MDDNLLVLKRRCPGCGEARALAQFRSRLGAQRGVCGECFRRSRSKRRGGEPGQRPRYADRVEAGPREDYPADAPPRPRTRGECADGPRPCPWVGCRYHLYLDVEVNRAHRAHGGLRLNFPDRDVDEIGDTCALDVADRGAQSLDVVGRLFNVTRERVRQLEAGVFRRIGNSRFLLRRLRQVWGEDEGGMTPACRASLAKKSRPSSGM